MTPPLLPQPAVPHAARLLVTLVAAFLAFCALAVSLPHARYIRFQQLATSSMRPALWIYERLHYDQTPIDVAIIGASRIEFGISAPRLQAALSRQLGRPVHVANLGMPQDGRDMHYALTRELLATHPEVRLILYSVIEQPSRTGHPAFRSVADTRDVVSPARWLTPAYLQGIAYLPYRQSSLFLQSLFPGVFGVRTAFDPARYRGTDMDTTDSFRSTAGVFIDRNTVHPAAELRAETRRKIAVRARSFLPASARDYEYSVERHYTRAITDAARRAGVQIGFVYLPMYHHVPPIADLPFYQARGVTLDGRFLAADNQNYYDYAHLNKVGAARATDWLADRLAALDRTGAIPLLPPEKR